MSGEYVVVRSELIDTREEARVYYDERLAGVHPLVCHGKRVSIYFPRGYTHFYSARTVSPTTPDSMLVRQRLPGGETEVRVFNQVRARLMDMIITAITDYTVSLPGRAPASQNRVLFGPRLRSGEYLCVILRPTKSPEDWTGVSAFPVVAAKWRDARRAKTAKFPP